MNSELIDKAFLESDLVSCIDYDVLNYKECLNKFAELIVNECLNGNAWVSGKADVNNYVSGEEKIVE